MSSIAFIFFQTDPLLCLFNPEEKLQGKAAE